MYSCCCSGGTVRVAGAVAWCARSWWAWLGWVGLGVAALLGVGKRFYVTEVAFWNGVHESQLAFGRVGAVASM